MIATLNSPQTNADACRLSPAKRVGFSWLFAIAILFSAILAVHAEDAPGNDQHALLAARVRQNFKTAETRFHSEPQNPDAALNFAKAAFDAAEFANDAKEREELAHLGIDASDRVLARNPKSAAGHYYLAMNLGQLAQTKKIGALKLVGEMEKEFQAARELDPKFDFAGPDRNLGWLYLQAPGWPASIGNRNKARDHLQRAVDLRPDYPENHLNLLEAFLKWGEKAGAIREYKALRELLPKAKKEFSGEQWAANWADWNKRWRDAQTQFAETERTLESPREVK